MSAINECGHPIEVRADSVRGTSVGWTKIEPGEAREVVATPESATMLYVDTRAGEDQEPVRFEVVVADLDDPPEGVPGEVVITVEGDRCPPPPPR